MKWMAKVLVPISVFVVSACFTISEERIVLPPDTPDSKIVSMHPKSVDPSRLPLDSIEELHTTGSPPKIDIDKWRLEVTGKKVGKPLSLSYRDLLKLETIEKKVLLICPLFFADYARWEGVPLSKILEMAEIDPSYSKITFTSLDSFIRSFTRAEVEEYLLFLALKVNGRELPLKHGFPVRLVAEDVFGGKWVKWIKTIEIN
jgi:sulfoxide reductase catalytic subunit YedY